MNLSYELIKEALTASYKNHLLSNRLSIDLPNAKAQKKKERTWKKTESLLRLSNIPKYLDPDIPVTVKLSQADIIFIPGWLYDIKC